MNFGSNNMSYERVMDTPAGKSKFFKNVLSMMRDVVQQKDVDEHESDNVFTLPGHALPSQYKTLLPVKDQEIVNLLKLERRRRLIRNVTLALIALIVFFIIVILTLILILQLSLNEGRGHLRLTAVNVNRTQFQVDEIKLLKSKAMVKTPRKLIKSHAAFKMQEGVRCETECWEYSAFRFKSECVQGFCHCRNENYDDVTCLPKTSHCTIRKHKKHHSFRAVHSGRIQTSYSCAPKKVIDVKTPEIHVISIFGNKNVNSTRLHFKSSKKINVTLILVSYKPVFWNLLLDDIITTQDIVLISHYGVSRTNVKILNYKPVNVNSSNKVDSNTFSSQSSSPSTPDNKNIIPHSSSIQSISTPSSLLSSTISATVSPSSSSSSSSSSTSSSSLSSSLSGVTPNITSPVRITRLLIRTGYGDDRDSGNTPHLLEEISRRIGPISSFFGVAHADDIVFDIGLGIYEIDTSDKEDAFHSYLTLHDS